MATPVKAFVMELMEKILSGVAGILFSQFHKPPASQSFRPAQLPTVMLEFS
jgi:hypothetical protein